MQVPEPWSRESQHQAADRFSSLLCGRPASGQQKISSIPNPGDPAGAGPGPECCVMCDGSNLAALQENGTSSVGDRSRGHRLGLHKYMWPGENSSLIIPFLQVQLF